MSEHQVIAFRAIDRPVPPEHKKYMEQQSSRAEITPWRFDNTYSFGDFHGNAREMLRRGYDIHLHYANYGYRRLMIRLPRGFPDPILAKQYLLKEGCLFEKDKQGSGGIFMIDPYFDSGALEEIWNLQELFDRLIPLRAEIMDGDLRPLYLAHLTVSSDDNHYDDDALEAPVPAGLRQITDAQLALVEYLGVSDDLLDAAAEQSPPIPSREDSTTQFSQWLREQPERNKEAWLTSWMKDAGSPARADMLDEFRKSHSVASWPTLQLNRTLNDLQTAADQLKQRRKQEAVELKARERAERLTRMKAHPQTFLDEAEEFVATRKQSKYPRAAEILAEVREALQGTAQAGLADQTAQMLRTKYPKRSGLVAELRKHALIPPK